jgi:GT2 family glycosyltransferase
MTLSIVIPSCYRIDLLRPCLASVRRYAPAGTQVIVVDDASTNGIVSAAAGEFPGVRVVRQEQSRGFCAAANAGIAVATGAIIEMLNDDTEVTEGWADAALRTFADPAIVAVAPLVLQHGTGGIIDSAGDEYDRGGFAFKRGHRERFESSGAYGMACRVTAASAAAAFYRLDAVVAVGGFPESFGAYFDDVDLSQRLRRIGAIQYEPTSVVWHHVSASHGRQPSRALIEQQSCNEERLYWRNRIEVDRWRTLPRHLAILAGKAFRRSREGRLVPWIRGRMRAWKELMKQRAQDARFAGSFEVSS